jgi:protein TonB
MDLKNTIDHPRAASRARDASQSQPPIERKAAPPKKPPAPAYTTNFAHRGRKDLFIGMFVSALIITSLAVLPEVIGNGPPPKKAKVEVLALEVIDMPKIEPDEPEVVDESEQQQTTPQEYAPPMLTDVPQMATDTSFVQQLQPPLPENVKVNKDAITIPQNAGTWAKGIGKVFDISMLDQTPRPTLQVHPIYPFEMRRAGLSGEVVVNFIVDTHGTVQNAYAVSSTQKDFEASAITAIEKWRFTPGRRKGEAVNTRMQQPVFFKIETAD